MSNFSVHLLQESSRFFFGPSILDWDTMFVDTYPPLHLSTSPVQIITIGTCCTRLSCFNGSYTLLIEKIRWFYWKLSKNMLAIICVITIFVTAYSIRVCARHKRVSRSLSSMWSHSKHNLSQNEVYTTCQTLLTTSCMYRTHTFLNPLHWIVRL